MTGEMEIRDPKSREIFFKGFIMFFRVGGWGWGLGGAGVDCATAAYGAIFKE